MGGWFRASYRVMRFWVLPALLFIGCVRSARPDTELSLGVPEISARLPPKISDREGWARDLLLALDTDRLPVDDAHVCQVIAIVGQESNFHANPEVPHLATIARKELGAKAQKYAGPLGAPVLSEVLATRPPGAKLSFDERLSLVRTEADLDHLYRDVIAEEVRRFPPAAIVEGSLYSKNPITTAGSMQVSVRFAEAQARHLGRDPATARDDLYTRQGGLMYGAARLFAGSPDEEPLYRFADYNAGLFSSRNAAFQEQLAALIGATLALDGDLLSYDADGSVRSVDTETMRALSKLGVPTAVADARLEKSADFERTATWRAVKRAWQQRFKREPSYARLPEVTIKSPKLSRELSTAWFARAVEKRYLACASNARKN